MLQIKSISHTFQLDDRQIPALKDVSFSVSNGEFFTLLGPSGCGKSTLLRIIAGLIPPTSGQIKWDTPPRMGFVFQNFALFPYLTVRENIAFGLKMSEATKNISQQIVEELVKEVGLTGFADKHPKELSGGMKQRVGMARALAIDPNVLLLDEPFSALDEFTAAALRELLVDLWSKKKVTVIMVTHLIAEAVELADQIAVLSSAPGTLIQILPNSLPRPRNLRAKEFFHMEDQVRGLHHK